jgi:hypothetical protein
LPELSGSQLGRLEDELRRERQRRASSAGGGQGAPHQDGAAPPLTEVLEYRPHEDGYLQLELRCYIRRDGSSRERGPYWYHLTPIGPCKRVKLKSVMLMLRVTIL